MSDPKLEQFLALLAFPTVLLPYSVDRDPDVRSFVWILNVPRERICEQENAAVEAAIEIYGDAPLPFIIGVATPEKTAKLFDTVRNAAPPLSGFVLTGAEVTGVFGSTTIVDVPGVFSSKVVGVTGAFTFTAGGVAVWPNPVIAGHVVLTAEVGSANKAMVVVRERPQTNAGGGRVAMTLH